MLFQDVQKWSCGVAVAEGEVQGGLVEGFRNNIWFYVRQGVCEFECVHVCLPMWARGTEGKNGRKLELCN